MVNINNLNCRLTDDDWLNISRLIHSNISIRETNLCKAVNITNLYLPPILICMGTVCNILVVMVMSGAYFRFVSTSFYMSINAIIDTFSLLVLLTVHWINENFPLIIYRGYGAHIMCKVFMFFGWSTSDFGIILTAAMTLERSLAIIFPLKSTTWCTVRRAKRVTLILSVFVSVINIHFLFISDINPLNERDVLCKVEPKNPSVERTYWKHIWPWIHNIFLIISFGTIITSNTIIIRHLKISDNMKNWNSMNQIMRKISNDSSSGSLQSKLQKYPSRRRQIAIMLLVDSFTIIVCTFPYSVYTSVESNLDSFLDSNINEMAGKHLLATLSFYLLYVNRCANFYLYCLSGSRFRLALTTLCCNRKNKRKLNYLVQIYSSSRNYKIKSTENSPNKERNS